jgi:hypothetical protein
VGVYLTTFRKKRKELEKLVGQLMGQVQAQTVDASYAVSADQSAIVVTELSKDL